MSNFAFIPYFKTAEMGDTPNVAARGYRRYNTVQQTQLPRQATDKETHKTLAKATLKERANA